MFVCLWPTYVKKVKKKQLSFYTLVFVQIKQTRYNMFHYSVWKGHTVSFQTPWKEILEHNKTLEIFERCLLWMSHFLWCCVALNVSVTSVCCCSFLSFLSVVFVYTSSLEMWLDIRWLFSGMALGVTMSFCPLVHIFGPDCNISTTGWIEMTF